MMKKYGCSNIDELVDEVKELRIKNKELKDERVQMAKDINSLDAGLHEHKSRHEQMWRIIYADQDEKIKELQDEIERLEYLIEAHQIYELNEEHGK